MFVQFKIIGHAGRMKFIVHVERINIHIVENNCYSWETNVHAAQYNCLYTSRYYSWASKKCSCITHAKITSFIEKTNKTGKI
jgi:hypothetical protein